jgi:hypothetical protein
VDITLDVSIPELEIEVAGDVRVDHGKITDIFIDFEAIGTTEGLEILDTGISIAELNVAFSNLDQPSKLIMSGGIGLEFGGQLSLGGRTVTLAYIEGDVYIDSDELKLSDSIYYGAYQKDNDKWTSVIYEGDAVLDLNWSRGEYSLSGDIKLPTDYGIKISEELEFSSEAIVLDAEAVVRVPDGIPLIGGDNLGSIDAAMLIDMKDSSESFAAGWITIDLLFTDEEAGIKYKFHSGDIDFLSGGDIKDIKKEIKDAESAPDTITRHITFDVPDGATSFVVDIDWGLELPVLPTGGKGTTSLTSPVPEMVVSAAGFVFNTDGSVVESPLSLHPFNLANGSYTALINDLLTVATDSTGATFSSEGFILDFITGQELDFVALAEGEVTLSLTYDRALDALMVIDTPSVVIYYDYPDPSIAIDNIALNEKNSLTEDGTTTLFSGMTLSIDLSYFTDPAFAQDANVKLYVDDDNSGHKGHSIAGKIPYENTSVTDATTYTYDWTIENVTGDPNDVFYFYARINNKNQSVVYTDYFGPYRIEPAVYGTVFEGTKLIPLNGFRVYLDLNGNGEYDSKIDSSTITDGSGFYAMKDVDEGSVSVGVIVPKGFVGSDATLDYVTRTYVTGEAVKVNFDLTQLTSITGVVFTDTDGDGVQGDDESGFFGVILYLDENGDETWTPGLEPSAVSDINGDWTFYGLSPDTEYTVKVLAYSSQITTKINTFTVNTSNNFVPQFVSPSGIPLQEIPQFDGYLVPFVPDAVEEVSDRRYMSFATRYFTGDNEDHHKDADPDGDGIINYVEWILGLDPTTVDGGDILVFEQVGDRVFELTIETVDRQRYVVQHSENLVLWSDFDAFRATATGSVKLTFDASELGDQSFIRVLVDP